MSTVSFWDGQYRSLISLIYRTFPVSQGELDLLSGGFCPEKPEIDKLEPTEKNALLAELRERLVEPAGEAASPALEYLSMRFALSPSLIALLAFFFLFDRYAKFQEWFNKQEDGHRIELMEGFTGLGRKELVEAVKADSPLARLGLLDSDCVPALKINRHDVKIALGQYVSYYLDDTHSRSLASFVLDAAESPALPLSAFELPETTADSCRAVLTKEGPGVLLLYGEPGTGKTELSKVLSREAGKEAFFLKADAFMSRSWPKLRIAAKLIDGEREVLIVDEAEALLSIRPTANEKAQLTQFLDDFGKKMILIVNDIAGIGDFTLRRIDAFVSFKPHGTALRERVWNALDAENPVFTAETRGALAREYPASPSRFRQVRDICAQLAREAVSPDRVEAAARDLLERGLEARTGIKPNGESRGAGSEIDIELLFPSTPAREIEERIARWREETLRFSRETLGTGEGLNLLFYGPPGTGKTAFARYLSRRLGIRPVIRRGSDLLGPYVGMTEQNIRAAFEEAKDGALIIDEADSFLGDRSAAVRTWERTQVNEFLTCMESFPGLFIATTNLAAPMDQASRRRFHFKVEFRPPGGEAKRALACRFFPQVTWDEASLARVSGIEALTPGDFSAVARRLAYAASFTSEEICRELEAEKSFGSPAQGIGF